MNWMSNRFARLRGVPRQGGAHARGPVVPEPRSETALGATPRGDGGDDPWSTPLLAPVATTRVLVAARDDDVRYLLQRRCQLSDHLQVVAETKEPISSLRAAARLRPDLIVVQVQSASDTEAELITAFKELSPQSKVFAYSTLPGGAAVSAAMAAGADRYAMAGTPLTALTAEIEDLVAQTRHLR
jgi:PleD family two-component response regulator